MRTDHRASRRAGRIALPCLAAALALAGCSKKEAAPPADAPRQDSTIALTDEQRGRIGVQPVKLERYEPTIETTGTVAFDGDLSTQVLAPISGPVTRILVEPGAWVKKGEPLANVSSPDFAAQIAEYRKSVAAADQTKRIADLDEQLFKNDALARRDLEQARTDATAAAADRDAALQALRALGVDEQTVAAIRDGQPVENPQATIRAPIEGTVVERLITPGQLLEAGSTPTFTIADLSTMWVMANVFESDLAYVQKEDAVDVTTAASPDAFHGTVDYVAALVDPNTRATSVRIIVPNRNRILKRDMYVTTAIHSRKERTGMLIPVASVLRDEENLPFVYVQSPRGTFARRRVTIGSRVGDRYQVTGGLSEGDRVVSEGGLFIQFAQSQ